MLLFHFYRGLYGGSKLQNHALNSRVNGEFRNKFDSLGNDLIIINNGKYLIHIDYLCVDGHDISNVCCKIIEKYIELLVEKINELLTENAEARIFEIISYAILKNHYKNAAVYFGYTRDTVEEMQLQLFKTGRTNANDGGIDFVMRPVGRFFQVTEVNDYDKYLLDIDKVMHFPVTFVIKTKAQKEFVWAELKKHIASKTSGMAVLEERYERAIEEIITINELRAWTKELDNDDIDGIIRDIDVYYKLEMNLDMEEEG